MRILLFLCFMLVPSVAFGNSKALSDLVTNEAHVLIGVDLAKVKGSYAYNEAIRFLSTRTSQSPVLEFIMNDPAVDLRNKVDALVFAAGPPKKSAMPSQAMLLVRGSFDADTLVKSATTRFNAKQVDKSGHKVAQLKGFQLTVVDKTTVLLSEDAIGSASRDAALKNTNTMAADKAMSALISATKTNRGIWMVARGQVLAARGGVASRGSSLSASVASGADVEVINFMNSEKDAKEGAKLIKETIKSQGGMAAAFGAKPLVDNAKVNVRKKDITLTTKISDKELKTLVASLKNLNLAPPANQPKPQPIPKAPGKGEDADFN